MSRGEQIRNRISDEYEKTPGYLLFDYTEAVGQEMDIQDEDIGSARAKLNVDNLQGEELDRFIVQHKGIYRKAATYAQGTVTVTGTGTITEGDLFETASGVQFAAAETKVIADTGSVLIQAVIPGNSGVVGSNTIKQMPVTIAGISACTNQNATVDGFDAEADDNYRERYYMALRTPATSANKFAYRNWALEVAGVGNVEVFPLAQGNNTVDVVIIDSDMKPADTTLVNRAQAYIDPEHNGKGEGVAPIGAHCYVTSAQALNINVTAKLTLSVGADQATVEEEIENNIEKYLAGMAFTGNAVSYAQIGNCIIDTEGVVDYENLLVNNGTSNVAVASRKVAVLNTAGWTYGE